MTTPLWWDNAHPPTQRIVLLEAHHVGFGASGRNGGWVSALQMASEARIGHAESRRGSPRSW
ncbi:MAG: hypothetical protein M3Y71_09775 [Actinomycetota bacterium]|nr:hypothetical protein [Actinomycetota bacterium]